MGNTTHSDAGGAKRQFSWWGWPHDVPCTRGESVRATARRQRGRPPGRTRASVHPRRAALSCARTGVADSPRQYEIEKDLYGKRRRVAFLLYHPRLWPHRLVIQCKWQASSRVGEEQ